MKWNIPKCKWCGSYITKRKSNIYCSETCMKEWNTANILAKRRTLEGRMKHNRQQALYKGRFRILEIYSDEIAKINVTMESKGGKTAW